MQERDQMDLRVEGEKEHIQRRQREIYMDRILNSEVKAILRSPEK